MVRAITGTVLYAAEGKLTPEDIPAILASGRPAFSLHVDTGVCGNPIEKGFESALVRIAVKIADHFQKCFLYGIFCKRLIGSVPETVAQNFRIEHFDQLICRVDISLCHSL